jgi:hypothetical protein
MSHAIGLARLAAAGLLLCSLASAGAQTGFNLSEAQTANQQALRGYRWNSRTDVTLDGQLYVSTRSMARLDSRGRVQMEQIGGTSAPTPNQVFQSQRSQAQIKKGKLEDRILEVSDQVRKYDSPSKKKLEAFQQSARRTPGTNDMAGTEQLTMQGFLKPDDQVTLWVDQKTGLQRRMEVRSSAGDQPFTAVSEFGPVDDGAWPLLRRLIDVPSLKVHIVIENASHMAPLPPTPGVEK